MYLYLARKLVDKTQLNIDFMRVFNILRDTKQELIELDIWYNHNCMGCWRTGSHGYAYYGYDSCVPSCVPQNLEYEMMRYSIFERRKKELNGLVTMYSNNIYEEGTSVIHIKNLPSTRI